MHAFQHIVSGDLAAGTLATALQLDDRDIVIMRDDLSVGPLSDVDQPPSAIRRAFWDRVLGPELAQFEAANGNDQLAGTAAAFADLSADPRPCVIWCGTGANEQLTLRRAAHFLEDTARPIWVADVLPGDQKPLPPYWRTGVGVLNAAELTAIFPRRRLIGGGERRSLASDWRRVLAESSGETMCTFFPGKVETRSIASHDARIVAAADTDWQRTVRLVGEVMASSEEPISDIFIFWRLRELSRRNALELDLPDAPMRESRVRRAD
jgi:hypothetical protein